MKYLTDKNKMATKLSEEQTAKIKKYFENMDVNKDGFVSKS